LTGALHDASRNPGITGQRASPSVIENSNAKCPKRPTQNDFGTAFVPSAVGAAYL
jgi:hypothetical protein